MNEEIRKFLSQAGKKGGEMNKKKGAKYFSEVGKKGAEKRWKKEKEVVE